MIKIATIAGSDASGGAGLEADLKTFAEYGLYGMAGSIWCWCNDLWIDRVKHDPPVNTPTNRPAEINRILRGGSYLTKEENNMMMRCAYIHEDPPELRHACLGMRVACGL